MSTTLSLPVVKVTVMEDRALVERRGEVCLGEGPGRLKVEGLSPLAVDRSLRVSLTAGTVVGARMQRAWREKPPEGENRTELEQRIASLEEEVKRAAADVLRLQARLEVVRVARSDVLRGMAEGAGVGNANPDSWKQQLETVRAEVAATEDSLREAQRAGAVANERLAEARGARGHLRAEPELLASAEVEVEASAAGTAEMRVAYLVPCAVWRPAYRATLTRAEGGETVTLECEAVVWQRTEEEWKEVELSFSTARTATLGVTPPRLVEDWLRLRDKTEREKQVVEVAVREEVIQTTGEGAARQAESMPGLDDGGEALTLKAPHRATVPADGEPHRVPLFHFTAPATSELVATPELSPLVHRVARFENRGPAVLLAGPVDLVRASGYVGRTQLKFAAPGERVKLGFGSEDALRVARRTEEKLDTSRLTGRRTRTHEVRLYVSNTGSRDERLALEERVPVSEVEAVEVKLLEDKTKPAPSKVSEDGIVRFELPAMARSQQEVVLGYTVSSSSKVAGL